MTVWSYKIARDYGFAPNPFFGCCTVACCKPKIRERSVIGDLIVGCGSSGLGLAGRMIFGMVVEEKMTFDEYWNDSRYSKKKPIFSVGIAQMYGDNIYYSDGAGNWSQADSHHSLDAGGWNELNAKRDLGSKYVLISRRFTYFGRTSIEIPNHLRNFEGDDLYPHVRDYRNSYSAEMQAAVMDWFEGLPRGRIGRPISWK